MSIGEQISPQQFDRRQFIKKSFIYAAGGTAVAVLGNRIILMENEALAAPPDKIPLPQPLPQTVFNAFDPLVTVPNVLDVTRVSFEHIGLDTLSAEVDYVPENLSGTLVSSFDIALYDEAEVQIPFGGNTESGPEFTPTVFLGKLSSSGDFAPGVFNVPDLIIPQIAFFSITPIFTITPAIPPTGASRTTATLLGLLSLLAGGYLVKANMARREEARNA